MIETDRPGIDLDGEWRFVRDPEGRHAADALPDGEPITVPGAWEAVLPDPYGIVRGWYHRWLEVPADWPMDRRLVLRFGSAMLRTQVWLDGRPVGGDDDGHLPFEVDAGPIQPGARHRLAVRVENPFNALTTYPAFDWAALRSQLEDPTTLRIPHGKQTWYSATSGLLGSVRAEAAPRARLVTLLPLPDLEGQHVTVRWVIAGELDRDATVELAACAPDGREVARVRAPASMGEAHVPVPDPVPWEPASPARYRLDALLTGGQGADHGVGDGATDVARVRFGMRSVAVRQGAILLNGRPIYLRGALDQDFWADGISNPPSRRALEEQAARAREMGLTLLRCHIKVPDPTYLDVADEAGLLLWCELPNWLTFATDAGATGRRLLARMVESMGHHPSIIAWTVINEDWGTDVRHEARDRRWIASTVEWLRALDPTRLVVDNSACETPYGPNTHVRTDIADFHVYRSMPDGLPRWRAIVEDYARRPRWLWSAAGDARESGEEALVLSEFGTWGLPHPASVLDQTGREPWWWSTGRDIYRPAGIRRRFREYGLDRVFGDLDHLAEATQWHEYEALQAQIAELRRHPSISGYVITELTDVYWEANGLLDVRRGRKAFHDRLAELNAPETVFADLRRRDFRERERLMADVVLSSFPDTLSPAEAAPGTAPEETASAGGSIPAGRGELAWRLLLESGSERSGRLPIEDWPSADARTVARLEIDVPSAEAAQRGTLELVATDGAGHRRASSRMHVCVLPAEPRSDRRVRRLAVVDPHDLWGVADRLRAEGHELVEPLDAEVVVATALDPALVAFADRGGTLLLLARSADAVPSGLGLSYPFRVVRRQAGDGMHPHEAPWAGDWITVFSWLRPGVLPGVPGGPLLDFAFGGVYPDHVLDGFAPRDPAVDVVAGMFAGWVHAPVALAASFRQGAGRIAATTFRVAPEDGPLATTLLEGLVAWAGAAVAEGASG